MYRNILLSAFLLALAVESVRGKPSCCCPCTSTPAPCSNPPTTERSTTTTTTTTTQAPTTTQASTTTTTNSPAKSNCVDPPAQKQPCLANQQIQCVPCALPNQCRTPQPCDVQRNTNASTTTTTTTTTTTKKPTTTTTLAPSTTTASPKSNCANGEIYPANTGSCDQFLMCRDQMYVLMVCPPGFGYNHQMKSCDWSANVPACSKK